MHRGCAKCEVHTVRYEALASGLVCLLVLMTRAQLEARAEDVEEAKPMAAERTMVKAVPDVSGRWPSNRLYCTRTAPVRRSISNAETVKCLRPRSHSRAAPRGLPGHIRLNGTPDAPSLSRFATSHT